jgi:hypothetical protein
MTMLNLSRLLGVLGEAPDIAYFRVSFRQTSQMSRSCLGSGRFGSVFGQKERCGELHRLGHSIAIKLPNEFVPAPCNTNLKAVVCVHRFVLHPFHRKNLMVMSGEFV